MSVRPAIETGQVERWLDKLGVPSRYRACFRRAYTTGSRNSGIKANCLWCQGFDLRAVYSCDTGHCPLWRFRPQPRVSRMPEKDAFTSVEEPTRDDGMGQQGRPGHGAESGA